MKTSTAILGSIIVLVFAAVLFVGLQETSTPPVDSGDEAVLTQAAFKKTVAQTDHAVLVKFGAPWCGPCRMIDSELKQIARDLSGEVEVLKINVDNNQEIAAQHQVGPIPKLVLYREGRPISSRIGYMSADEMATWIANTK